MLGTEGSIMEWARSSGEALGSCIILHGYIMVIVQNQVHLLVQTQVPHLVPMFQDKHALKIHCTAEEILQRFYEHQEVSYLP